MAETCSCTKWLIPDILVIKIVVFDIYIHTPPIVIALLFYIILWSQQKYVAGNIMKNSTVYCLMCVCSCFVMISKFYIFSAVMHSKRRRDVVTAWRVATLPMSCNIVRISTTRSVHQSYAGYLRTSQPFVVKWFFPRSFLYVLVLICGICELEHRK
jgi:hypothetical protein